MNIGGLVRALLPVFFVLIIGWQVLCGGVV